MKHKSKLKVKGKMSKQASNIVGILLSASVFIFAFLSGIAQIIKALS